MRELAPAQYQDLWPLDRGASTLRRAKQHVWLLRRRELQNPRKSVNGDDCRALEEAFEILHRLQGERWRDVVQERYYESQERIAKMKEKSGAVA